MGKRKALKNQDCVEQRTAVFHYKNGSFYKFISPTQISPLSSRHKYTTHETQTGPKGMYENFPHHCLISVNENTFHEDSKSQTFKLFLISYSLSLAHSKPVSFIYQIFLESITYLQQLLSSSPPLQSKYKLPSPFVT